MCEILGFSYGKEYELNRELREFYSHAPYHPNGWGLALFYDRHIYLKKQESRADQSDWLRKRLSAPIYAKNAVAHIRLATIGNEELRNCHPFVKEDHSDRKWTLAHNGTVFESERLVPYAKTQTGETDSERILLYLVDRMNEKIAELARPLTEEERFSVIDGIVSGSSEKNKLNLMIFDGDILYVHTNFRGSLYRHDTEKGVAISTQPLSPEDWRPVEMTTLLAFRDGCQIFSGTNHGREYIYDESSYQPLYMAFAGL